MPIQPLVPIVIPATQAVTADGLWISNLSINAPSTTKPIRVSATIVPFVTSTGELFMDKSKTLTITDLSSTAGTDTSVAVAVNAIYAAIQSQVHKQNLF